jgi:insertion element IS1 protein InsB
MCNKFQQSHYSNQACLAGQADRIVLLYLEGLGIRSLSRVLKISTNTILSVLYRESLKLSRPLFVLKTGKVEIDELQTYIRNKKTNKIWIAYALERSTGKVIDFRVGNRSNRTLRPVVQSALLTHPSKIYTDKLPNYRTLIPSELHGTKKYRINKIERMNLKLRNRSQTIESKNNVFQ